MVLAGDHVYKMDYELMLEQHVEQGADVTVGCIEVPRAGGDRLRRDARRRERPVHLVPEKPKDPPGMPDKPEMALASMGIYVFDTNFLFDQLRRDAARAELEPRFRQGHHPLHRAARKGGRAPLLHSCVRTNYEAEAYWRDVGTVDAYWAGQYRPHRCGAGARSLRSGLADLDLLRDHPPAKFVHDDDGRRGEAIELAGFRRLHRLRRAMRRSLLFTGVRMHFTADVENAVILPYVVIGALARGSPMW